jgi:hypothetical protein
MATYNKRGHKAPKPKEVEEETIDAGDSTTAEVFNSLDEGASRTEEWIAGNQNLILSIIGAIAIATAGYLLFNKFVSEPKEVAASTEMYQAQQYFDEAVDSSVANDSLFTLALNGGEGSVGFLSITQQYGGTKAGSLANYYAGISYLKLKKYTEDNIFSVEDSSQLSQLISSIIRWKSLLIYCEYDEIAILDSFRNLSESDKNYLESSFVYYMTSSANQSEFDLIIDSDSNVGSNTLNLDHALNYISTTARIVVENPLSDKPFLDSLVRNFQKYLKKTFIKDYDQSLIEFANAGGRDNILNELENQNDRFVFRINEFDLNPKVFVLMDSDRNYIDENFPNPALIESLKLKNISFHVLQLREIENYLSDAKISEFQDYNDFIKAYLSMTPLQKGFFKIEKGFPNKNFDQLADNVQSLYSSLDSKYKRLFRKEKFPLDKFKINYSAKFRECEMADFESVLVDPFEPDEYKEILIKIQSIL